MSTQPTDLLEEEHRHIQEVAGAMRALAEALEAGRAVEGQTLQHIVDFLRTYADRCHHGKEEAILFPLLVSRGVPVQGCPIGALSWEHEEGRKLVGEYARAVEAYCQDAAAWQPVAAGLRALAALYQGHIWKEDYLLFPMTNKVLGPADQAALSHDFTSADAAFEPDAQHRFEQAAAWIAGRAAAV